jgi:hypothetical protein
VKTVVLTPPKATLVVPVKLLPVVTTGIPTDPLPGLKLSTTGVTRNFALFNVPLGVSTATRPVLAPDGTVAVI